MSAKFKNVMRSASCFYFRALGKQPKMLVFMSIFFEDVFIVRLKTCEGNWDCKLVQKISIFNIQKVPYYRPQRSWAKVMFLQACVCPGGGEGCLPQCMLEYPPPRARHHPPTRTRHTKPPQTRHTTPPDQTHIPPGPGTPPPWTRHPPGKQTAAYG